MDHEPEYIKQLRELYKTYTGRELEAALGISIRSVQNYLKEENPTIPSNKVIKKVREVFAHHVSNGNLEIKNPGPEPDQGYKDLYIAQLKEHNDFLKKRVSDLEAVRDQLTAIERTLSEVRTDMGVISALQQGYQEYWAEYYPPKNVKPAEVQRMIHTKAALRLAKIQKEGIHL
jgi:transcriptional regulator with XRE-family HTH domain